MAAPNSSSMTVELSWDPPTGGSPPDYYVVYRRPASTDGPRNAQVVGITSSTSFSDDEWTTTPSEDYYYSVASVSYSDGGEGLNSPEVSATMPSSGTVTTSRGWKGDIILSGNVSIDNNSILTISKNTTIFFEDNTQLRVYGTLIAEGTSSYPIVFTSSNASPSPDDWYGIRFEDPSNDNDCILKYCEIKYADYGIYCYRSSPSIHNNIISNNIHGIKGYITKSTKR